MLHLRLWWNVIFIKLIVFPHLISLPSLIPTIVFSTVGDRQVTAVIWTKLFFCLLFFFFKVRQVDRELASRPANRSKLVLAWGGAGSEKCSVVFCLQPKKNCWCIVSRFSCRKKGRWRESRINREKQKERQKEGGKVNKKARISRGREWQWARRREEGKRDWKG